MLGTSIGLNAVSTHGACTAIFVLVAAIAGFLCGSIQTLGRISWLAWIGLISIVTASESFLSCFLFLVIPSNDISSLDFDDRCWRAGPSRDAPQVGPWSSDYELFKSPSFTEAISAISSLVFAYAGTPAFFSIVAEMRDPHHYTRSLLICQGGVTATYITIGVVVYYYCGSYVASPALGSAGVLMKKVSYGLALPGLLVSTTLFIHVSASLTMTA
jgi:amino acid permease